LWELVRKDVPTDSEALGKVKDLLASDTIAPGNYEEAIGGRSLANGAAGNASPASRGKAATNAPPASEGASAPDKEVLSVAGDRLAREAVSAARAIQADSTNYHATCSWRAVPPARSIRAGPRRSSGGSGPTGNAFELSIALAEIEIEPFKQNLTLTEEKLKAQPTTRNSDKIRTHLRKEINTRELELHRSKADRYPTELTHRLRGGRAAAPSRSDRRSHPRAAGGAQ